MECKRISMNGNKGQFWNHDFLLEKLSQFLCNDIPSFLVLRRVCRSLHHVLMQFYKQTRGASDPFTFATTIQIWINRIDNRVLLKYLHGMLSAFNYTHVSCICMRMSGVRSAQSTVIHNRVFHFCNALTKVLPKMESVFYLRVDFDMPHSTRLSMYDMLPGIIMWDMTSPFLKKYYMGMVYRRQHIVYPLNGGFTIFSGAICGVRTKYVNELFSDLWGWRAIGEMLSRRGHFGGSLTLDEFDDQLRVEYDERYRVAVVLELLSLSMYTSNDQHHLLSVALACLMELRDLTAVFRIPADINESGEIGCCRTAFDLMLCSMVLRRMPIHTEVERIVHIFTEMCTAALPYQRYRESISRMIELLAEAVSVHRSGANYPQTRIQILKSCWDNHLLSQSISKI